MNVQRPRLRSLLFALALVVAVTTIAGIAIAAGTSVTLEFKGQYAKARRTACHKSERFRLFHRRSTIEFRGFVTPHPAGHFPMRLELKRCAGGQWRDAGNRSTIGKKLTGKYKGFFSATPLAPRSHRRRAIVYYSGRAIMTGGRSTKAFFAVTN